MTRSVVIQHTPIEQQNTVQSVRPARKWRVRIHLSFTYTWPGLIGVVLFLFVACAFYISPVHYLLDGQFSLLMDEALIHNWTPNMMDFQVPRSHSAMLDNDGYPYSIKIIKGRLLYVYPWGSPLLSLPAVLLFNAHGFKIASHRNGYKYSWYNELRMQTIIATVLCAMTIWVMYEAAVHFLSVPWSLVIASAAAFGTPIWSSASRSLWPQTWALLLITVATWILLTGCLRPFLLGSILAWSCLVRPQVIPQVIAITGYVLVRYGRGFFWRYAAAGLCWAIPICAMMWVFTGGFFSASYSAGMLDFPRDFCGRLYGVLLSPSRGFIVFSPVILIPVYLTIWYWKILPERRLAILALIIISMHLALLSSFICWWGGGSYGPRLMLEAVPWFVLLAILGVSSFVQDHSLRLAPRLLTTSIAALALAASIATNAPGALEQNSTGWRRFDPDHLEVLWDWHDPQFLCWLRPAQN
jgi:hypothetical protein